MRRSTYYDRHKSKHAAKYRPRHRRTTLWTRIACAAGLVAVWAFASVDARISLSGNARGWA